MDVVPLEVTAHSFFLISYYQFYKYDDGEKRSSVRSHGDIFYTSSLYARKCH